MSVTVDYRQLAGWLRELLAGILGLAQDEISEDVSLDALGIDSLTAVSLTDELQRFLGRPVAASLFLEYPTIRAASEQLLKA